MWYRASHSRTARCFRRAVLFAPYEVRQPVSNHRRRIL